LRLLLKQKKMKVEIDLETYSNVPIAQEKEPEEPAEVEAPIIDEDRLYEEN